MCKQAMMLMVLFILMASNASAMTVYCTNCSNRFTQALDRITKIEQLQTLMSQYDQDLLQTAKQARMVLQNIEQFQNMLENTKSLSPATLIRLKDTFVRLGQMVGTVNQHKGEVDALGEVFNAAYSNYGEIGEMVRQGTSMAKAATQEKWTQWAAMAEEAIRATFKLTGQQLAEISDSAEFDVYVQDLLNTPTGRMEALQAANQLAAIQVNESRSLRALLATSIQEQAQLNARSEKERQLERELWRKGFESDVLRNINLDDTNPTTNNF